MAQIRNLKDNGGSVFYPLTHERAVKDSNGVSLESKLAGLESKSYVEAWDGASTPVVANIPAGVTVTYNTTTYTGTLAASASTIGKIYMVKNGSDYDRYITSQSGSSYSWVSIGSTELDLTGYATNAELAQLASNVDELDETKADKSEVENLGLPPANSVYIQQVSGGIITYTPKHWINEYTDCTCDFVFKYPDSAVSTTQFILTIEGENGNDYIYFASGGINANIGGTLVTITPPISSWGGQHTLRMEKEGTTITFYLDGVYCNLATLTPRDAQTIYIGGYPGAPAANALISFYSLTVWNDSDSIVEKHTATDGFSQMTGTMVSTANFVDYYEKNVVFSGAYYLNETITIANRNLYGNGCLILCGTNAKIIINDNSSVQGFQFIGNWTPTRTKISGTGYYAYVPIMSDTNLENIENYTEDFFIVLRGTNSSVLNCVIKNFDKTAIMCDSQGAYTNSTQVNINGNELYFNRCGIGYKTEFATIGANRINACLVGIYAKGGNLSFVNNKLLMCDSAIVIGNTGNGGHSEFTGNEIAHCGMYGIYCPELGRTLGNLFVGGQIFDAPIKLINTSGFMFVGCRLATWYELTEDNWPQGIDSNAVHSCYITRAYADRDQKPLFYYPDGGLSLKLNTHPYDITDSEVNN